MSKPPSARPMTAVGQRPPSSTGTRSAAADGLASRPMTSAGGRAGSAIRGRPGTAQQNMPTYETPEKHLETVTNMTTRPSSAMNPPGTAARGGRTTSTAAPKTSMANRPASRAGTAVGKRLNVTERPVTQQGLQGVRPATRGQQRQVMDKSYYMGLLRTKISDLSNEVARLSKEIDHYSKESQNMNVYEKKYSIIKFLISI